MPTTSHPFSSLPHKAAVPASVGRSQGLHSGILQSHHHGAILELLASQFASAVSVYSSTSIRSGALSHGPLGCCLGLPPPWSLRKALRSQPNTHSRPAVGITQTLVPRLIAGGVLAHHRIPPLPQGKCYLRHGIPAFRRSACDTSLSFLRKSSRYGVKEKGGGQSLHSKASSIRLERASITNPCG